MSRPSEWPTAGWHRASTPKFISPFWCLILVLPAPGVLEPTQWVSDRVGPTSRGTKLLIILFLQLSSFLGQLLLGLTLTGPLGLPLLFFLLGSFLILLLSCNAGRVAYVAAFSLFHCSSLTQTLHRCTLSSVLLFFLASCVVASA